MAKNMTRKGLAIGASVALAAAGVVGISSPAMADSNIYLVPSVGGASQNRVPIEEDFTLKTYYGVNANGLLAPVSVQVTDPDENLAASTGAQIVGAVGTGGTQLSYSSTDDVWAGAIGMDAGIGNAKEITLTPKAVTSTSETFSVIVTTFFDGNGDGVPDAGENQASQEIFFHVDDDYEWVLDFTKPEIGDTFFEATVSTTVPSINLAMIADQVGVGFAEITNADGTLTAKSADTDLTGTSKRIGAGTAASDTTKISEYVAGTPATADAVAINSDGTVDFKVEATTAVVAASYVAAIVFDGTATSAGTADASVDASDEVKRAVQVVGAATITDIEKPTLVAGPDVKNLNIRNEASSVSFESTVYKSYTSSTVNELAAAGTEITVTVTQGTWDADSVLVIGGQTLDNDSTDNKVSFTVETNSDGEITFSADPRGVEADDTFTVALSAQGVTELAGVSASNTFTVLETAGSDVIEHNLLGGSAAWKVQEGTHTILFAALDNFDQPLVGSKFRVKLNNGLAADDVATSLSGGVATFSVSTERSDEVDVATFTATLQEASGATFVDIATETLAVNLGSSNAADKVTVTGFNTGNKFKLGTFDLALADLASANGRLGEVLAKTPAGGHTLAGSITDASGVKTYGNVTFSGENVLFKVVGDTKDVYSLGSVTVQTNAAGDFAGVEVFSNTAGDNTVTVTSGSASQVITLTFADAAEDTGTNLVIDAPTAVEPGSTLVYTATLADKYGNPVAGGTTTATSNAKFNYDGPGFVVGSLPEEFGANGTATVTIFLGNNDDGKTGTLTVSYTPTNNSAATYAYDGDDDLVVQKTVNIGDVPLAAGEFNAWTKLIDNDTAVKFYAKNPSNQGKIQFFFNGEEIAWHRGTSPTSYEGGEPRYNEDQDAYYLVRDVELVSGMKNVFEIEQDGERIWRAVKTLD